MALLSNCCRCRSSFFAPSSILARRDSACAERARLHSSLLLSLPLQLLRSFFNPRSTRACFAERARWHCSPTAVAAAPVSSLLLQSSLDASLLALSALDCTPPYCYRCRSSFFAASSILARRASTFPERARCSASAAVAAAPVSSLLLQPEHVSPSAHDAVLQLRRCRSSSFASFSILDRRESVLAERTTLCLKCRRCCSSMFVLQSFRPTRVFFR